MTRDQLQGIISEPLAELCARYADKNGRQTYDHFIDVLMAVIGASQEEAAESFSDELPIYEREAAIKELGGLIGTAISEQPQIATGIQVMEGVIQARIAQLRGEGNL